MRSRSSERIDGCLEIAVRDRVQDHAVEVGPVVDEPTDLRRQASMRSVWLHTISIMCSSTGILALVEGEVHLTMQVVGLAVAAAHPLDHGVARGSDLADGGGVESRPCPAQRLDLKRTRVA